MKPAGSHLEVASRRSVQPATQSELRAPHSALRTDLPFVLLNMSMTADGKIASANRAISSFGSRRDHAHLLELRATAEAVMCGARTADLNRVDLGPGGVTYRRLRLKRGLAEYNLRIIVSGSGTLDARAHVFFRQENPPPAPPKRGALKAAPTGEFPSWEGSGVGGFLTAGNRANSPIIILTTARAGKARLAKLRAVADAVKVFGKKELNLRAALRWLHREWNVRRLVCEGGGELNDALFRAGLVDELHLTVCPKIIGGREAPTLADGIGAARLAQARALKLESARRIGDELFLVYRSCISSH